MALWKKEVKPTVARAILVAPDVAALNLNGLDLPGLKALTEDKHWPNVTVDEAFQLWFQCDDLKEVERAELVSADSNRDALCLKIVDTKGQTWFVNVQTALWNHVSATCPLALPCSFPFFELRWCGGA